MDVKLNLDQCESQAFDGDEKVGYCQYQVKEDKLWDIQHTVVNKAYGGKGLAGKLLDAVVDYAKENEIKLIPTCSYAKRKFDENPDKYGDVAY